MLDQKVKYVVLFDQILRFELVEQILKIGPKMLNNVLVVLVDLLSCFEPSSLTFYCLACKFTLLSHFHKISCDN